jgi:hypothetical protein
LLLARSASAVDEALLFLPAGAQEVPAIGCWTEEGRRARRERPDRFERRALESLRVPRQGVQGVADG